MEILHILIILTKKKTCLTHKNPSTNPKQKNPPDISRSKNPHEITLSSQSSAHPNSKPSPSPCASLLNPMEESCASCEAKRTRFNGFAAALPAALLLASSNTYSYILHIYILLNNIIVYYYIEYIHCTKLYRVILYYMLIIYYVQYTVAIINILYITVVIIIIITYPLISSYI